MKKVLAVIFTVLALSLVASAQVSSGATVHVVQNPQPTIASVSPVNWAVGGTGTLTVTGTNFQTWSVVMWGGTQLQTTYVSATKLTAQVTAAQTATVGDYTITVDNSKLALNHSVDLDWVASTTQNTSLRYRLYKRNQGSTAWNKIQENIPSTTATDTAVSSGDKLEYTVTAYIPPCNPSAPTCESDYSNIAPAVIPIP